MSDRPETETEAAATPDGPPRVTVLAGRPAEPAPPPPAGRRGGAIAVAGGLLAVLALAFGVLLYLVVAEPARLDAWLGRAPEASVAGVSAEELDRRIETARRELAERLEGAAARLDEVGRSVQALRDRPAPPPAEPAPDRAELEARIAALEEGRAELDRRIGELASGLDQRLDSAGEKLADLMQRMESAASRLKAADEAVSSLGGEIGRLDARTADAEAEHRALTRLAVAQLELAVATGEPFAPALAAARGLLGASVPGTAYAGWADRAEAGVPTVETLRRRFGEPAAAVRRDGTGPDAGWFDRTLARLQGVVSVRRVDGDTAGDTPDAVLARAEAKLRDGDLAAAVAELDALPEPARAPFADWLADARARLAAEDGMEALVAALPAEAPAR